MSYLIDTSVLCRLANISEVDYEVAARSLRELHDDDEILSIAPQVLIEFRNVATRPVAVNGLGMSAREAEITSDAFEASFSLFEETPDLFPAWKVIVERLNVVGKQVHDARLVAFCHVHQISHLLTFNVTHFARLASFGPGLTVVSPAEV